MYRRNFLTLTTCCALAFTMTGAASQARAAGTAPAAAQGSLLKMIEAVKAESYEAFLVDADAQVKKQLSRQQFEGMCGLYSKALRKGYKLEYFGQLRQHEMNVFLWKITVVDEKDESLLRLAMKDGKVSGFSVS